MSGRRLARSGAAAAAALYLAALAAIVLALRLVGEAWWATTVLLYVPRSPFAAPLPPLVAALWLAGLRRLAAAELVLAGGLLAVLTGLTWSCPSPHPSAPTLRILSFNAAYGHGEPGAVCRELAAHQPQLLVVQGYRASAGIERCLAGYERQVSGEFLLASRFPIRRFTAPPRLASRRRAGFVEYGLDTPLGPVDLFNVHPISPRDGVEGIGSWRAPLVLYRRFRAADGPARVRSNTEWRREQVEALAAAVARARHPVVVAGDTNLPVLSPLFAETLGGLQDGFARAGAGFGQTFPADRPWMRIDRILASPELRFVRFRTGSEASTTHLCVVADLQAADPTDRLPARLAVDSAPGEAPAP